MANVNPQQKKDGPFGMAFPRSIFWIVQRRAIGRQRATAPWRGFRCRANSRANGERSRAVNRRGLFLDLTLCGLLHLFAGSGLRLQPMQIIGGLLRVAGGGEDRALIVLEDLQPRRDIGGVVVAGFRRDAKIGA